MSRPVAKPYRNRGIKDSGPPHLNDKGLLDFSPDDIESEYAEYTRNDLLLTLALTDPKNWSKVRRWYITVVAVLLVVNATFASSSPSGAIMGIVEEFNVSTVVAELVITLFLLGYVFGPLLWAPLSEFYGRRYIFYITFAGYFAFTFLCAFTKSFAGLLVGRFLTGTFCSAALSNSPGVLVDIWGRSTLLQMEISKRKLTIESRPN